MESIVVLKKGYQARNPGWSIPSDYKKQGKPFWKWILSQVGPHTWPMQWGMFCVSGVRPFNRGSNLAGSRELITQDSNREHCILWGSRGFSSSSSHRTWTWRSLKPGLLTEFTLSWGTTLDLRESVSSPSERSQSHVFLLHVPSVLAVYWALAKSLTMSNSFASDTQANNLCFVTKAVMLRNKWGADYFSKQHTHTISYRNLGLAE